MRYESALRSALVYVYLFCGLTCAVFVLFVPDALAKKPPGPPPPPALSFSPQTSGSFDYGEISVGGISSVNFTLTNSSGTSTTLAINLSGSSAFAIVVDGCTGISLPNGRSCVVVVSYTSGAASGNTATLTAAGVGKKAQAFPTSLTLNGSGEGVAHIYWSNWNDGSIRRANLDGSDVQTVVTGSNTATGIAISSRHIYWTGAVDDDPYMCGSTIRAANLDGSGETTIISGQNCAYGLAIDDTYLYWTNVASDGTINRVNLDGSNPVTLVTGSGYVTGVAVNSGHLYWGGPGGVYQANLDGSDAHFIQNGVGGLGPCGIAVDESYAYVTVCNGLGVYKASLAGGDAVPFPGDNGDHIALYDGRVYWAPLNRIDVVDVDGSNWIPGLLRDDVNGTFAVTVGPK